MSNIFIGTEGEKSKGEFELVNVKQVPNNFNYGRTYLYSFIFVAEDGKKIQLKTNANVVKNFSNDGSEYFRGYLQSTTWKIGSTFNLEFVVKKHYKYASNEGLTIVKNAKLIENIREVA